MLDVALTLLLLSAASASAATRYVWQGSSGPAPPYTSWATAAHVIQDAVDAAQTGDTVLVAGGVYATGGRAVSGTMTNRVAIGRAITVESLMGPEVTIIQGYRVPGTRYSADAIRCVYLANGATLSGFTLTNGSTRTWAFDPGEQSGGGVYCAGSYAVVSNCTLVGNSAWDGGGAAWGTLNNCTLTGNSANRGAMAWGTLNNCVVTGNTGGGGAFYGTLNHCTVTGNASDWSGGGVYGGTVNNSIVYYNSAPNGNYYSNEGTFNYSCTTPDPGGVGNITADPQLASDSHLSAGSPCRGAGSAAYATLTDIDGEAWASPPSIGCDEYHAGVVTGPLSVSIAVAFTNVAVGCQVALTAMIEGRTSASTWDFGDGVVLSNQPYAKHAWAVPRDYQVVLRAFNETHIEGVGATAVVHVVNQPVHYVAAGGLNPLPPYTSWATAATNLQDAVDAVTTAGALVLATNGLDATGGRAVYGTMTNRVAVVRPLTLRSVNGSQFTIIEGYRVPGSEDGCGDGAIRCAYLTNGASLSGFTLTNGATLGTEAFREGYGGGVWCEWEAATISNCKMIRNSARFHGGGTIFGIMNNCTLIGNTANTVGGGTLFSTLNNCTLTGNSAYSGGGACGGTLNNCTLSGNSATDSGGGVYGATLNNCIVYFNTAANGANYTQDEWTVLNFCCTTPMPTNGAGNITNAPLFLDYAGGNLRLQSNSPCINAGTNYFAPGSTDLDGRPRIVGARVDIGAYEFQGAGMGEFLGWLQHYGLPTDGSADYTDPDADGHNNWQEWRCQTDPTNALSVLRLLTPETDGTNVTVRWSSVAGVSYYLLRSAHLTVPSAYRLLATNILGQAGTTSYTDTNAARRSALFYRVGVGNYIAPPSPPPPTLTCQYDGGTRMLQLSWEAPDAQLQEAATPNGPWQTVTTAVSPYWTATAYPQRFYRLILPAPGKKWLTVAAVTMTAQTNTAANLQTIFSYMEQAASSGVDLVVFPEVVLQQCPASGTSSHTPTAQEMAYMRQTAETIPGQSTSNVVAKANELNLFVVFGMTEKDQAGLLYNANVFLGPDGVIGKHRKTRFIGNDALIWRLGTGYKVLASPVGKIGLIICIEMWSDGNYPGPVLAGQGADLLVTSSAWWSSSPDGYDIVTVQNAVLSKRWHVVSNQVGKVGHVDDYGHSRVVDPKGTIVCDTGTGAGLVMWATDILIDARAP